METQRKQDTTNTDASNGSHQGLEALRQAVPPGISHKPDGAHTNGATNPASSQAAQTSNAAPRGTQAEVNAWQRVQLARHPDRPHTLDYIQRICTEFVELHGDRLFGEDASIIGGLGCFNGETVMVIGQQKG
ncbi:MAG TPA: hypothetical protein VND68_13115, partial [Chloroflexia bacterium]|nr:hypothetical protein [Chloroflexia bacterium]